MGVLKRRHGSVTELTLDWPAVRNAMGPKECAELRRKLEAALSVEDIAAVVISATAPAFCAGGNLTEMVRLARLGAERVRTTIYGEFQQLFRVIRASTVPVICALDGPAIGFGCDLALAANLTIMGKRAWLAQGWAKAGLVPATGGTLYALERGGERALWALLTTERLEACGAEELGLAISCDDARTHALERAARLSDLPRDALKAVTQLGRIRDWDQHLEAALNYQLGFITSSDFAARTSKLLAR